MKTINKFQFFFFAVLALLLPGCKDLPVYPDCFINTDIMIDPNQDCTVPCEKIFSIRDPQLLPEGARITWTITKGGIDIPLENPSAITFPITFTEPGNDYLAALNIVFDFQGCDTNLSKPFRIGVDAPVAIIKVDKQECIVGDCEITFTNMSQNATSWTWTFPGDASDHSGEQMVVKTFNDYPDTFQVILTASNLGGVSQDTVDIFVEPVTFITDRNAAPLPSGSILCVDENADGSFTMIGNTGTRTYQEKVDRNGVLMSGSRNEVNLLPATYTSRIGFDCFKVYDQRVVVGATVLNPGNNQDAYLVAFDNTFSPTIETAYFYPQDGSEKGFGITEGPNMGYLLCGAKSTISPAQPTGMLLFELNSSFEKVKSVVILDHDPFNQAFGIISITAGYALIGQALNPATGEYEGCFFKIDHAYKMIGEVEYLGANFLPNQIIKINNDDYIILASDGSTGIVQAMGTVRWHKTFGNTHFQKAIITTDQQLAITGYAQVSNKDTPLLLTLNVTTGEVGRINKTYPLSHSGRIMSIAQTQDNGFVLGGLLETPGDDVGLIIRTDKEGLVK